MKRVLPKLAAAQTSAPPGGLRKYLKEPSVLIKTSPCSITQNDLVRLFTHEITALQIKNFYPKEDAKRLGKELGEKARNGEVDNWRVVTSDRGLERSDVWTMGDYIPYNVAVATNQLDAYFDGVERDLRKRRRKRQSNEGEREEGGAYLWPLDQFRLELDEIWSQGATLARDKETGRLMGGGLPRIMLGPTRWKKGFVHADQFSPLSTEKGLFSANIYLQLPSRELDVHGADEGELHVWPLDIRTDWEWYSNQEILKGMTVQDAELQVKLRKALGGAPLKVKVCPGDLVLLCVQRPHAAVGFKDGTRVSLQCFIQYHGYDERLLIDI
mmetsp:Transcript_22535/g.28433  ORF Transcript_22535/g.28433 Transcript_22535/m.28433 type:complete len:327 (+) Transcript_22535:44-1024(+)|eukprot:CAMPEP_0203678478 /NCGR_PEP_ID=MMETSP0090-20130426/32137_1 /ASSEMBLY_ACC=CAM_ASM_001088 /TAXON_ID=426623 /ORGANISM="Chaetoceros affinis, Strain CCMP159" /LENGTH=326 /DNA_ID=CAMNT_0050545743 /DNA_START=113 /DNA_END=1093 /DNA_ORIENTATION=-